MNSIMINERLYLSQDILTEGELSSTQCVVSLLDLYTISLSLLDLRTVYDCPEDSVYHNLSMFN